MLRERLTFANVMSSIAVFIALGGGAYAVTGSGGGLDGTEYAQSGKRIYACVAKRSGTFELANRSKRCGKGERKISWQVKGPRGKRGKRGAKGDVGVRGSRGPQGVMGPEGPKGPAGENGENGSPDTPEQVLDKLLEVDGPGSGLNAEYAELLGGIPASGFVQGSGGILTRGVSVDVGDGQDEAPLGSVFGLGSFRLVGDPDPIGPGDKCMIVFHNQSGAELLFSDGVELANGQQEVMIGVNTDNAAYSDRITISDATGTRFMSAQFEVAYGDTWMSDSPDLCAGFVSGTHS